MTSYAHLTVVEALFMTIIAALTNLAGIPTARRAFKDSSRTFQGYMISMSIITSFMYHICEIYDVELFLNELQWHRLDNVFAITCFQLVFLHLFAVLASKDLFLRWSTLLTSIVIQEKAPWDVRYTIAPCLAYLFLSIFLRFYRRKSRNIIYNRRHVVIGLAAVIIGVHFFKEGLDDQSDYLRINHGAWHLCAAVFGYFSMEAVNTHEDLLKSDV